MPGTDVAGIVEAVGRERDPAAGGRRGVRLVASVPSRNSSGASEDHFVPKPAHLTFEQAAAIGVSATTALQLLRDQGRVRPGEKVRQRHAGGVGTFAVQIAKSLGAEVTGVCSTKGLGLVRSIGADHVIDYTTEDFTAGTERYDYILDNIGNHSLSAMRDVLTPDGRLQPNGGGHEAALWPVLRSMVTALFVRRQLAPSIKFQNRDDLVVLKGMVEAGQMTPVIDGSFP